MKNRKTAVWGKTIFFLLLTIAYIILLVALWDFLYLIDDIKKGHRMPLSFAALIVPLFLLYGAFSPWIGYKGIKDKIVSGQIMLLDENGYYVKPLKNLDKEELEHIAKAFDYEEDYRYEEFSYDQYCVYLKTCKNGFWFFPHKKDKSLIRTGEPGGGLSSLYKGFRVNSEAVALIEELFRSAEDGIRE